MVAPPSDGQFSQSQPPAVHATLDELVARARAMMTVGERRILGIVGAPGAGKSTLCTALLEALGGDAALVAMDGFHLANTELERLGRRGRKGAPDTFDADGYAALLARLRVETHRTIYAPTFDRQLEESIGSAVAVPAGTPLVLTEGNYLLLPDGSWGQVRSQLDAVWFLDVPEDSRLSRLVARHVAFGKAPADAQRWVDAVDGPNAATIKLTRARADLIVQIVE
ncbi:nucleoside/nucleotide kinase family protein [Deinococcus humi]|uniref:Pantothenate kinase n=1 Tax=Deinococcus humi TaxID=662880 RepID=A0A7W8NE57_9DEIO|nr:nucleoside/nucleotide kinase family protein [Deinococcus humi]MBB5363016.1 pantothenate kinase [Deinococcus humi]GGO25132.1 nucleoside/nucleotide kinase family protein [Deinococcus humi]